MIAFWFAFGLAMATVVANTLTVRTGRSDAAGRGMAGAFAVLVLPFPLLGLAIFLLGRSTGAKAAAAAVAAAPLLLTLALEGAGRISAFGKARAGGARARFREPGARALAEAIAEGRIERVRFLLQSVDPNAPGKEGESLLGFALRKRQVDAALELARRGADPLRGPAGEPNALRLAAQEPVFVEVLRALLANGTSPDAVLPDDIDRPTPLVFTAINLNAWPNVRAVVEAGARLDVVDVNGRTPLARAILWRAWNEARLMVERGAPVAAGLRGAASLEEAFAATRPPEAGTPERASYDLLLAALAERGFPAPDDAR